MQLQKAVLDCLYLFSHSESHRLYTLAEFQHYCLFPLVHEKVRLFYADNRPVGFVSWAWLTNKEANDFLSERWMPDETVWERPNQVTDQYQLWGIDFIAPFGHSTRVMRGMVQHSNLVLGRRVPARWRRFKQPDKIHLKEF